MSPRQKWSLLVGIILFGLGVYILSPILTPFFVAALLAYLGNPIVNRLIKWHFPRWLAVISVFGTMLLAVVLLLILFIPLIEEQLVILFNKLPVLFTWLQTEVFPWINQHWNINIQLDMPTIKAALVDHWRDVGNASGQILKTLSHSGKALIQVALNIILIPVVTFYLLRDWPKLMASIQDLIPRNMLPTFILLVTESNEVLGAFFRGQLLVMLALGILYSMGLELIGIDLSLLIGITIAILSVVPYLGTVAGLLIAVIAALLQFNDVLHLVYVLILFGVGHALEGMVLTPWLVGDRIGLHPVAVIFAILAGGALFGFIGVLLALPVAAVIMVLVRHLHTNYLNSQIYKP